PRIGEQAAYAGNNAGGGGSNQSNNPTATPMPFQVGRNGLEADSDSRPKLNMPFQFIREEQLAKLPLIFREMSSAEVAIILASMPPAWASRLLITFDSATQVAVTRELTKGREVPPDVVAQVEERVREKLPYMVGGKEWIQSVFPLTPPQAQR